MLTVEELRKTILWKSFVSGLDVQVIFHTYPSQFFGPPRQGICISSCITANTSSNRNRFNARGPKNNIG
jgi:hypothetical protein